MNAEIRLYETLGTPCPYLEGRTWVSQVFVDPELPSGLYEGLLSRGFRRSGLHFYRNECPGCRECRQLRVPVLSFTPTKSMRRVYRKNLDVEIELGPVDFDEEVFRLYTRYTEFQHGKNDPEDDDDPEENFKTFLCASPFESHTMKYRIGGRLAAVGWLDFLPDSLSSVYFAFDPDFAKRSLGTFSVLKEIELAGETGRRLHYLGFYVSGSPKMRYKGRFGPHEVLYGGVWRPESPKPRS
jgi:arginine-tRNA-protein transferase